MPTTPCPFCRASIFSTQTLCLNCNRLLPGHLRYGEPTPAPKHSARQSNSLPAILWRLFAWQCLSTKGGRKVSGLGATVVFLMLCYAVRQTRDEMAREAHPLSYEATEAVNSNGVNIPTLIGDTTTDIDETLGMPHEEHPSLNITLKSWGPQDNNLVEEYREPPYKIAWFYLPSPQPAGRATDVPALLKIGNLTTSDPRYALVYEPRGNGIDGDYKGVKIIPTESP